MIRSETPNDYQLISQVHLEAFSPSENESELIKILRKTDLFNKELSLIAFEGNKAVGHILFYPLSIETNNIKNTILGLVPLGVRPKFQKKGYGSRLIKEGLKKAKELGYLSVFVVGNPKYYGQFGFRLVESIKNNREFPKESFLGLELIQGSLKGISGTVIYPSEFDIVC